jgi:hypothetical protein
MSRIIAATFIPGTRLLNNSASLYFMSSLFLNKKSPAEILIAQDTAEPTLTLIFVLIHN